jgi:hypothetical protein
VLDLDLVEIHPVQVSGWKKAMAQNVAKAFGPGATKADAGEFECERDRLHAKIDQQAAELDRLAKAFKQLGLLGIAPSGQKGSIPK